MRNIYIIMSREKNKKPTNSLDQLETHSVFFIELYPVRVGFFICGVPICAILESVLLKTIDFTFYRNVHPDVQRNLKTFNPIFNLWSIFIV